jgi:hypothetical protein
LERKLKESAKQAARNYVAVAVGMLVFLLVLAVIVVLERLVIGG